ncbi:expressed unknown protein [Seminavis robusta]|uniref:Uncharacterized protein n=1 Tax=Seminavis robusta TaxID=568900 RepID=A0A9N8H3Y5_9STRA|nr:expressed unknown protein [Seminavis robusta]|eukprot:Sro49_g028470.1 n/a (260) ;mRNA; r:9868-10647
MHAMGDSHRCPTGSTVTEGDRHDALEQTETDYNADNDLHAFAAAQQQHAVEEPSEAYPKALQFSQDDQTCVSSITDLRSVQYQNMIYPSLHSIPDDKTVEDLFQRGRKPKSHQQNSPGGMEGNKMVALMLLEELKDMPWNHASLRSDSVSAVSDSQQSPAKKGTTIMEKTPSDQHGDQQKENPRQTPETKSSLEDDTATDGSKTSTVLSASNKSRAQPENEGRSEASWDGKNHKRRFSFRSKWQWLPRPLLSAARNDNR